MFYVTFNFPPCVTSNSIRGRMPSDENSISKREKDEKNLIDCV